MDDFDVLNPNLRLLGHAGKLCHSGLECYRAPFDSLIVVAFLSWCGLVRRLNEVRWRDIGFAFLWSVMRLMLLHVF